MTPSAEADGEAAPPQGIPAATIVVFRRSRTPGGGPPEILMTIRSRNLRFAGGAAVFPGGRVDPADFALATKLGCTDVDEAANRIAALRETLEETGLAIGVSGAVTAESAAEARAMLAQEEDFAPVLERFGWTLRLEAVVPYARWFPKNERLPRIFDTRFYLYDIGTGAVDIAVDASENSRLFWITAQGALDAAREGDIKLIFPTRRNLERLAGYGNFAEAVADARAFPVRTITPWVRERDGEPWIEFGDDHGYPVTGEPIRSAHRGD